MLDWIFEGIITWISSIASSLMDAVSGLFLNALGADMTVMEEYFPFITVAYTVMQYMAWAILFLITVWQLFRTFGGPITEAEHPLHLIARSSIFALLIGYARPIFMVALDIARAPYTALLDLSMTSEDFTFAGLEETLSNGLLTIASTVTVIAPILLLILLISIGWNYFKLLLETVERYIVVGVLCYTSPLAFAMGGSKETNQVFKSWCRMVGSQLLLLVMNVWFLRAFSSSVGQYIGNGGAVSTGHGSIFLWFFCALAFLKTAQRFDSYLASIGLNVAQTGSSMGMEMLMAARVLTGFAGSASSAGSVFRNTSAAGTATATGFAAGFANRFKPNSYVRDAVVEGCSRMGLGGSVGFVGRAFGGIAARNGATLTGDSISSVATRPDSVSGSIGGDIANRSLGNYMPQLGRHTLSNTQITGGHISTTATDAAGKTSNVELFNAAQFEAPTAPHSLVNAADGSSWYQVATGEGKGAFYDAPNFTGSASEAARVAETFPGAAEGTMLRTVGEGVLEATTDNGSSLWYNSAFFAEPDAPHSVMQSDNGVEWYAMQPKADAPRFEQGDAAIAYNQAEFRQFMPGFEEQIVAVDSRHRDDGHFEVRHEDGSGTAFYGEAISNMATALQKTLYGAQGGSQGGESVPLTDEELIAFVERQNCNETRKHILSTALSLVGKVPYFWGGKSDAGWNDEWNTPKVVTATGSSATGTILPYGLDCSGFTDWVFKTAMGVSIKAGSWNQWDNSYAITEAELLPGDLGFMAVPGTVPVNHVLIYAGENEDGAHMWVHCTSGSGVVLNSPDYVSYYRRPINADYDAPVLSGTGLQTTEPSQNSE